MSKLVGLGAAALLGIATVAPAGRTAAAVLGPKAAECRGAGQPAMLVKVIGLKSRTGLVRVQSYGGDPQNFFAKGSWLDRVEVETPASGTVEVCMPVPAAGTYAVSVRHDANGSHKSDMKDGGGMSGNPEISMWDVMLKRRPDPAKVSVRVGRGVTVVPVVLNYVQGGSFKPVGQAG